MFFKIVCFLFLASLQAVLSVGPQKTCPCKRESDCNPVTDWKGGEKEVLVVANRTSDYKKWLWHAFSAVIEWNDALNSSMSDDLMCYAHSQGKKYGFYIENFEMDENRTDYYITEKSSMISYRRADLVVINLVDYLGSCTYASFHVEEMINKTTAILSGIKKNIEAKLLCLMPWKPPCYETNCDLGPALAKQCDAVIFSPESYNSYCSETCTAKPTVSYNKMILGVTEYYAAGFNKSQLLLGIPWHGYNYTCKNDDHVDKWSGHYVCHLKYKTDNSSGKNIQMCDLEGSRKRINAGHVQGKVPEITLADSTYSNLHETAYIVDSFKSGNKSQNYMTWFENIGSLMKKYDAVNYFDVKGCVIFTADDLTYSSIITNKEFDDHMWSWMLHSILSNGTAVQQDSRMNIAGTVAGVAVGMFLLGFILGALILCIIFRRQRKLRPPFSHDRLEDEYKDDFDHNQL